MHVLVGALAALVLGQSQIVVFQKDSAFRGASMQVAGHQAKDGRVLLTDLNGAVFSVPEGSIDWERSAIATAKLNTEQAAAEQAARQARAAEPASRPAELSVLEASRMYGVSNPGVSVTSGSSSRVVSAPPSARSDAGASGAKPPGGGGNETPAVKAARERLASAEAEQQKLEKALADLRADTNPDPLWAARRDSQIQATTGQLSAARRQTELAKEELDQMIKAGNEVKQ